MATYSIPEFNLENLEKKLARIQKKAQKYGCDFSYVRTGDHYEKRTITEQIGIDTWTGQPITKKHDINVRYIDIDVSGTARVGNWQYVASLEYTTQGNIIHAVPDVEIPKRYYTCSPWCEHCKTQRDRKSSYIVMDCETGDFKQVGSSCIKDFTRGLSAEAVSAYESLIHEMEEAHDSLGGWYGSTTYFDTVPFLSAVAETIRIYGYIKRGTAGTECTADRVIDLYKVAQGLPLSRFDDVRAHQIAKHREAVAHGWDMTRPESIALAEQVRAWILGNEKDDNYFHNLKVVCGLDCVDSGKTGLLASAFPAYDRELEYQAEKLRRQRAEAEAGAQSRHVGNVGDRISFITDQHKCLTSWDTQYGTVYVYKFVDQDGNVYTWKTSKWISDDCDTKLTITGTVKEHKEYRGVLQTEVTRCKIARVA